MLVLGIAGSPRRGGNSEILLDRALDGAKAAGATVEKVVLSTLDYTPCIACGECDWTGQCILEDDMQMLYDQIGAADAMIFASPIYFYGVSAWAKGAIDRSQALWARRYVMKDKRYTVDKNGFFIATGATKGKRLFDGALMTMKYFYDAAGYIPAGELLVRGVDEKGAIKKNDADLGAAYALGQTAAEK